MSVMEAIKRSAGSRRRHQEECDALADQIHRVTAALWAMDLVELVMVDGQERSLALRQELVQLEGAYFDLVSR